MTERKTQESEKAKLRAENEQTKQELAASKKELLDLKKA
jgi:chromosome segregation ATPase